MWKRAIYNIVRYVRRFVDSPRRGFSFSSGISVNEDSAMQVSAMHRGIVYISTQIAKLPWDLKDKNNSIINNGISFLLNVAPNDEMTAMDFRLCMIQNAIIHGNAYAEIERNLLGQPVALWPMRTRDVCLYRVPETGKLVYKIVGGSIEIRGEDTYLEPRDIFHIKNFHTKDGLIGQGIVAYAADTLGISLGADRMAGNIFGNGGLPSGVISVTGSLSDEAHARLEKSWVEANSGKKSGGVAVLEEGATFTPTTFSPEILQFLESRKFGVVEIARFLGLPPTKLFDTDAATFNNLENANLEVAVDTLDAWARMLEAQADVKLINNQYAGVFTELDLYAVFRGDMKTRSDYFSKMMQSAAMTPNEVRMREGLAPYKGGDRYYIAANNFSPVDRIDEIVDAQVKPKLNPPAPAKAPDPNPKTQQLTEAAIKFLEAK